MSKFLDETGLAYFWEKIKAALSTVAFTGSYNDLSNKPNIPAGSTVDTALSSTSENPVQNKVINTALGNKANDADVVKLSGNQTVDGVKTFSNSIVATSTTTQPTMRGSAAATVLRFWGGNTTDSAKLILCGKDFSSNKGQFLIVAADGTNSAQLVGKPDGTLTWTGNNVITAAGGTLTGELVRSGIFARSGSTSGSINMFNGSSAADGGGVWAYAKDNSNKGRVRLQSYYNSTNNYRYLDVKAETKDVVTNCNILPATTNTYTLGTANAEFSHIYGHTGSVETSDERLKDEITQIPDNVLDAWEDINWTQYKFKDSIAEKGINAARLHTGMIAQRIDAVFKAHNLDASKYGFFCYDSWDAVPEIIENMGTVDTDGNILEHNYVQIQAPKEAGDKYSLRYEEALCIEAAYQRRRADRAEARITALEQRLNELEEVLATLGDHSNAS